MGHTGGGGYDVQARGAAEHGGGDPSMMPGRGDRRMVLILAAAIAAGVAALVLFG